jgi:hypothetical protein
LSTGSFLRRSGQPPNARTFSFELPLYTKLCKTKGSRQLASGQHGEVRSGSRAAFAVMLASRPLYPR